MQFWNRFCRLGQIIVAVRQMDTVMCMMIVGFEFVRDRIQYDFVSWSG